MSTRDDINNSNVFFAGLIGTLIVADLVLLLSVLFFHVTNQQAAADADVKSPELVSLWESQRAILSGKAPDAEHKTHLPIERAMQLVVKELATDGGSAHAEEKSHAK